MDTIDLTLNPYDTGARCEPHTWNLNDDNHYGRVDFDDAEGRTVAMAHVSRDQATGRYVMSVTLLGDDVELRVSCDDH